jgi:hypothetical protein
MLANVTTLYHAVQDSGLTSLLAPSANTVAVGFMLESLLNSTVLQAVEGMSWNLRVWGRGGQATLVASPETHISQLQQQIEEKLGVPVHLQELLGGFPPKLLQVRQHDMVALVMPSALHARLLAMYTIQLFTSCVSGICDSSIGKQRARHRPGQQATTAACNRPFPVQVTDPSATISSVGIANGDSLTVRQAAAPAPAAPAATPAAADGDGYAMVRPLIFSFADVLA